MRRKPFLAAVAAMLSIFLCGSAWLSGTNEEEISISPDVKVIKLTDGVWRHISTMEMEKYGLVPANGLLIVSKGKAAMIDTPWTPEQTTALIDWLENKQQAHLEFVIPTHRHIDCIGGLDVAHKHGAKSYALDQTIELAKKEHMPVPQNSFKEPFSLLCGDMTLELFYPGPGHTVDNIVVWFPMKQILFGGCAVKTSDSKTLGNLNDADTENWPATMETLLKRYPDARIVVPGHGKPGGLDYIKHTLRLLREMKK